MKEAIVVLFSMLSISAFADYKPRWQFGIGPSGVSHVNASDITADWRFGFGWNIGNDFEMAVVGDWAISYTNTDMHYFTAQLAGDYNFSEENTTPFVTADLGYGSIHAHADCPDAICQAPVDDAAGVSFGVGGGYKFFRNDLVQLGLLAHYDVVFATTRYGTPSKYSLQAIAYF